MSSPSPREMTVSLENLASYVSLVSHWLLGWRESPHRWEGFNSVFPISRLLGNTRKYM